jgi:formiminotetrahydrofolate cyclodeaminase
MVLKSVDDLRRFCDELASDDPSPGGGSASAAAGAMGAALLSMVCGITLKNRRYEPSWPELEELRSRTKTLVVNLIDLAARDAEAYDGLLSATRALRASSAGGDAQSRRAKAVETAIRVPLETADACMEVLRLSQDVAAKGTRSASSDVNVATLLASAGVDGALANVEINLPDCDDDELLSETKRRVAAILDAKRRIETSFAERL